MPGNSFGELFRVTTAGVSHGPGYLSSSTAALLACRWAWTTCCPICAAAGRGNRRSSTQRQEDDVPEIWSGVFEGKTDGTSIGILFRNTDQRSADYGDIKDKYRPGHADFTFDAKYGFRDYRGGGRSSARETMCRVAAGAIAKKLLARARHAHPWIRQAGRRRLSPTLPIRRGHAGTGRGECSALPRSGQGGGDDRTDRGGAQGSATPSAASANWWRSACRRAWASRSSTSSRRTWRRHCFLARRDWRSSTAPASPSPRARQPEQRPFIAKPDGRSAPRPTATAACSAASAAANRSSAASP